MSVLIQQKVIQFLYINKCSFTGKTLSIVLRRVVGKEGKHFSLSSFLCASFLPFLHDIDDIVENIAWERPTRIYSALKIGKIGKFFSFTFLEHFLTGDKNMRIFEVDH